MRRALFPLWCALVLAVPFMVRAQQPLPPAEVTVGIDLSTTGPASSLGGQSRNAVRLWPSTLGGLPANYVLMDDGSDAARAVANIHKLITVDKADAIVGPNITPLALAALPLAAQTRTPMITLAGSSAIVDPVDASRFWVFKMPQNDSLMAEAVVQDMVRKGYRSVAFFGFADAYGDGWWQAFSQAAAGKLQIVAHERFPRSAKMVVDQTLRILSAHPSTVLIAASGAAAVLPQQTLRERGYAGQVYQTHGIGTSEFLRTGGSSVEGTLFPVGPGMFARLLPEHHPVRQAALAFADKFEAQYGPGTVTQFSADAYGAWMLLDKAVTAALQGGARPGTSEFRAALRLAIENTKELAVPNGVLNVGPNDHQGFDQRARVMGAVRGGKFVYVPE